MATIELGQMPDMVKLQVPGEQELDALHAVLAILDAIEVLQRMGAYGELHYFFNGKRED